MRKIKKLQDMVKKNYNQQKNDQKTKTQQPQNQEHYTQQYQTQQPQNQENNNRQNLQNQYPQNNNQLNHAKQLQNQEHYTQQYQTQQPQNQENNNSKNSQNQNLQNNNQLNQAQQPQNQQHYTQQYQTQQPQNQEDNNSKNSQNQNIQNNNQLNQAQVSQKQPGNNNQYQQNHNQQYPSQYAQNIQDQISSQGQPQQNDNMQSNEKSNQFLQKQKPNQSLDNQNQPGSKKQVNNQQPKQAEQIQNQQNNQKRPNGSRKKQKNTAGDWLVKELQPSFDIIDQTLQFGEKQARIIYVKSVTDNDKLDKYIIKPFFELKSRQEFDSYLTSLPQNMNIKNKDQILLELTKGQLYIETEQNSFLLDNSKVFNNIVPEANIEPTILGPKYALSEDLKTSVNLIRQRYHNPSLKFEIFEIGRNTRQNLALVYDEKYVNQKVLEDVQAKVKNLKQEFFLASSELQRLLTKSKYSLMPTMIVTERTDRLIYNLSGGKVAILVDGSPTTVIVPAVFFDFMTSMEDNYHPYWITKFVKTLRYFGLYICLLIPASYVAIISYNPEVIRSEIAFSIAGSRIGVPFSSFVEVMFLLIFMELLTEASIRLPKAISGTAATVGGLILGNAVTEAALTSSIMVIIVSAVAVATFAIPINEMAFAVRVVRYIFLFFATISGIAGLTLSLLAFIMYMTNITSFGQPYLKIYMQKKKDETKGA